MFQRMRIMSPDTKIKKPHNEKSSNDVIKNNAATKKFPIVGIGASSGGLGAFESFFSGMPVDSDTGMAFILVQHLAPDHKSLLTELIQRHTSMKVFEAEDGMKVKPDCTYIIPPNKDMAFINGTLQLHEPALPRGQRMPIDFFFKSLAQDQGEHAICIVLSGTGSDGTLGLRAIKAEGGIAMVQKPESTEYDGMLRSAINTCLVDYELLPEEMAPQLVAYNSHPFHNTSKKVSASFSHSKKFLKKIFIILQGQTGHDFSLYKSSTIQRRIERRMAVNVIEKIDEYVHFLQRTPHEVDALFRDMLIGVTNFFRDIEAFEVLEKKTIPELFKAKPTGSTIRIWSAGCSTGEEAYSIAILIQEYLQKIKQYYKVHIFATDIDSHAIAAARSGIYPANIVADITPERLSKFFSSELDGKVYRINKNIREMLVFSEQNIISDPPFSRLDLISCRNLLIYMNSELQKKVIPMMHYALNQDGILFLGSSDSIGEFTDLFTTSDRKFKLFQRKEGVSKRRIVHGYTNPHFTDNTAVMTPSYNPFPVNKKIDLKKLTEETLLKEIAPAAALVNRTGDILYLHGRTGTYLEPSPGEAGINNIIKMAREGLRNELTIGLHKVSTTLKIARSRGLKVKTNGQYTAVDLTIRPATSISEISSDSPLFLIVLKESSLENIKPSNQISSSDAKQTETNEQIEILKEELLVKEEFLQTTIEELETSNEELKSSNEELQSINEEFQSTNEELETSKEELQSINEELSTVNTELQINITDLSRANNDMNNLLAGTGIGTIFLDQKLRVLSFTPTISGIINLIAGDIGRPITHIASNLINYDNLLNDAQSVLDTLIHKEIDVQTKDKNWYTLRILPYRTIDDAIEGVVINFY
jgi:two-component system CheB/CheR fusion protein